MDNENEFEIDGKGYQREPQYYGCHGCAFDLDRDRCDRAPACYGITSGGARYVTSIFVEKHP